MSTRCKSRNCTLWYVGEGYCATHLYAARHRAHCIEVRNNPIKVKRRKPARKHQRNGSIVNRAPSRRTTGKHNAH